MQNRNEDRPDETFRMAVRSALIGSHSEALEVKSYIMMIYSKTPMHCAI